MTTKPTIFVTRKLPDAVPALPVVKSLVPAKIVQIAPKPVLETAEDVEVYRKAVRSALMKEIEQDQHVRLE